MIHAAKKRRLGLMGYLRTPVFFALFAVAAIVHASGASAQVAPSGAPGVNGQVCDVTVRVRSLDGYRLALSFRTFGETRRVAGIVTLLAGRERYEIRFRDVFAAHIDNATRGEAMPILVRFPGAVGPDGAVVSSLDGVGPCPEPFSPWIAFPSQNDGTSPAEYAAFRARVESLPVQDAPAPEAFVPGCATPFARAQTLHAFEPVTPRSAGDAAGLVHVLVTLDASDRVVDAHVFESSGNSALDITAADAARRSTYVGAIFNCRKVVDQYIFIVMFQ